MNNPGYGGVRRPSFVRFPSTLLGRSNQRTMVQSGTFQTYNTPTPSALIEARKGVADALEPPSLSIVGQPDLSLPGVQRLAPSASESHRRGQKATRARAMKHPPPKHRRMAHFAPCHRTWNAERPVRRRVFLFFFRGGKGRAPDLTVLSSSSTHSYALGWARRNFAFCFSVCHAARVGRRRTGTRRTRRCTSRRRRCNTAVSVSAVGGHAMGDGGRGWAREVSEGLLWGGHTCLHGVSEGRAHWR